MRAPLLVGDFRGDVVADAGADRCLSAGASVSLDASATRHLTGEPLEYTWRDDGGCALARGPNATVQLGAGLDTIWLEVSDGHGGHVSRDSALVAVSGP